MLSEMCAADSIEMGRNEASDAELPIAPADHEESDTNAPFVAYDAIRDALMVRGIPSHEIAFLQEATSRSKREALMEAVRRGAIRILLAGAQNTGLNVQERLIAVHNVDVPWRPGDLEQRIGRAQRQGNAWPQIYVCNYAVEGSFDAFLWQVNHTKAQFIAQFERGDVQVREIDDIDGRVMTAAEMKAIASGNPQVVRKFAVDSELARLDGLYAAWRETQLRMRQRLHELASQRRREQAERTLLARAAAAVAAEPPTPFAAEIAVVVGDAPTRRETSRAAAGAAVRELVEAVCALHGISEVERQMPWLWSIAQRVVLARYRGVLLECVVTSGRRAAVLLALPDGAEAEIIPETSIAVGTSVGVWSSVDAALRQLDERVAACDRALAVLEQDEARLRATLEQPWEHTLAYRALSDERDALNRALGADGEGEGIGATSSQAGPMEQGASPRQGGQPVAERAHLVAPPVVLPDLRDEAAMRAASQFLQAADESQAMPEQTQALTGDEHLSWLVEEQSVSPPANHPIREGEWRATGVLIFGDDVAISRARRRKPMPQEPSLPMVQSEQLSFFP